MHECPINLHRFFKGASGCKQVPNSFTLLFLGKRGMYTSVQLIYIACSMFRMRGPAMSNFFKGASGGSKSVKVCGANGASEISPDVRCEWCIPICQDV